MNRWFRGAAAAGLALLSAAIAPAYDLIKDESNIYVVALDPGAFPIRVMLPTSPTLADGTTQSSSFVAAVNAWNALLCTVQLQASVLSPGVYATGNEVNEIVMDSDIDGTAFDENTLAVTMSYHSGNSRVESDIIFNTAYTWDSFRGGRLSSNTSAQDLRRVAIHELGHMLGLDHPDQATPPQSVNAIMNSRVSYSPAVDTMQNDDIAGAQSLYGAPGFVPSNNNFASAFTINLSSGSTTVTGTNIAATTESGEPAHGDERDRQRGDARHSHGGEGFAQQDERERRQPVTARGRGVEHRGFERGVGDPREDRESVAPTEPDQGDAHARGSCEGRADGDSRDEAENDARFETGKPSHEHGAEHDEQRRRPGVESSIHPLNQAGQQKQHRDPAQQHVDREAERNREQYARC